VNPQEMLAALNEAGEDAGADYNDGAVVSGWLDWSVNKDGLLTITHKPGDGGPSTSASWKLIPLEDPLEPLSFAPSYRPQGYEIKPGVTRRWRGQSGKVYTDRDGWFHSPEIARTVPVMSIWFFDGPMTEVS
jgi:hypothetical protein